MSNKLLTIITAAISIIGIILFVLVARAGELPEDLAGPVSTIVTFSTILFYVAVAVAVVGSLFGLLKNPAALKKSLFGIIGLGVVVIISYLIASGSEVFNANGEVIAALDSSTSKLTSAGIWVSTLLLLVSGAYFVWDLLKGLIKS